MIGHTSIRCNNPSFLTRFASLTLLTALAAACGGGGGDLTPERAVQRGQVVYDRVCATCHARSGAGIPMLGSKLIDSEMIQSHSDSELVDFLREGRAATDPLNTTGVDMPPKGGDPSLTDQDLANIVTYLRTF